MEHKNSKQIVERNWILLFDSVEPLKTPLHEMNKKGLSKKLFGRTLAEKEYQKSDKAKASRKRYAQSDVGKANIKISHKKFRQSEKGKAWFKRYQKSDKAKAARKKYRLSDKGKESYRRSNKKYEQSEKGKASRRLKYLRRKNSAKHNDMQKL